MGDLNELSVGDMVEVHHFVREGVLVKEVWESAQVISIYPHRISVRFKKRPTELLMLSSRDKGRKWR